MSPLNWSLVIDWAPTTAASLELSVVVEVPPQPAATSTSEMNARRMDRFIEKAPFAADSSRCLTRGQYSIDQSERLRETVLAQGDLAIRDGVDGGVDPAPQVAQLVGAEHHLPDARLAAAKDEVVGAGARELQLRLLDQEEILHGLGERAEAVLRSGLQLAQLVLGLAQRQPAMEVDLESLRRDVVRRNVSIHPRVDAGGARRAAALAGKLGDRLGEHLDIKLEAERRDMARLLVA